MDIQATTEKMKSFYAKSKAARKEGKKDVAASFRNAGQRLQRQLKVAAIQEKANTKKKTAEE